MTIFHTLQCPGHALKEKKETVIVFFPCLFQELLEKAEENSSGEEQWDINFRKHLSHDTSVKKKKKKVSESSKKGGSLSNLTLLSDVDSSSGQSGGMFQLFSDKVSI